MRPPTASATTSIRRRAQPEHRRGFIWILTLHTVEVIEGVAEGRLEVVGFVEDAERRIGEANDQHNSKEYTENDVRRAAQIPRIAQCPVSRSETQQYPCLIIKLEDRIDAITEIVAQIKEVRAENEQRSKRDHK